MARGNARGAPPPRRTWCGACFETRQEVTMARIAFVVGEDFEDSELRVPLDGLRKAGHVVEILGDKAGGELRGKKGKEQIRTDAAAESCDPESYDALVIPGGYSPDHLRTSTGVVTFVRDFVATKKPIAAVCHGP